MESALSRRDFIKTGVATVAGLSALGSGARPAESSSERPPNLLIIHTDQQSSWTLGIYGGTLIDTPKLDAIGREGAVFNNFFTNSAVCTPSRGCFLTGRYPHAHGAYKNNIELNRDEMTIARVLQQNGYETGYAGKWHLDGTPKPGWMEPSRSMGFEDCRYMFNRGHWKKIVEDASGEAKQSPYKVIGDEKSYTTDWLASKTIDFIKRPREKPFFFMVSIPDPHTPYTVRPPYDTMLDPADMPIPSTFSEKNPPKWAAAARRGGRYAMKKPRRKEILRRNMAGYCGEVKCIDDNVGRILDCLAEQGILNDTIVVFSTDHGDYMGEHGLLGKNQLYETAYRIPMLIRWPKRIAENTVVDNIVSTVDFQTTILSLMDIEPSGREQGHDASAILQGQKADWPDVSFIHHASMKRAGIFTRQYELAYVQGNDHILFDRTNDPEQVNNLFSDTKYKNVIDELTEQIIAHSTEVDSPALPWLKELR